MGLSRAVYSRALASFAALAVAGAALAAAPPSASASPAEPTPVSSAALPTAQLNGVVWSQVVSRGIVYVGGSFDQSQPAGAEKGADVTSRSNLFAYDVSTGIAVPGFSARANGQVRAVAASSDGSRIYIAGSFTSVNGTSRQHVAALNPDGTLVSGFAPSANGPVYSIVEHGGVVYFGGSFSAVGSTARARAAAVDTSGRLTGFAPSVTDEQVRALAVSSDGRKVLLAGSFTSVNGAARHGLAAVAAASGASLPWSANSVVTNGGTASAILSLSTRGGVVYGTGYGYKIGGGPGKLEGAIAMDWADGHVVWVEDCHGDTYSSYPFNDAVYTASHAHECRTVTNGFSSTDPVTYHRALAFSQAAVGVLGHNQIGVYSDFGGLPSPKLLSSWMPDFNTGTYTGMNQGPWSVAGGSKYVVYGGEFTRVNGVRQTGLVRFLGAPEPAAPGAPAPPAAPPAAAPAVPGKVAHPDSVALGPSKVAVRWKAPKATSASITSYRIRVQRGSTVVKTVEVAAKKRIAVVSGLSRATSYKVRIAASGHDGAGTWSVADSVKTRAAGANVSATKKPHKVAKPKTSAAKKSAKVRWNRASVKGALAVTKYQIRILKHGEVVKRATVSARARSKTVAGLSRHAAYTVSVRASNWAGWSTWSAGAVFRTK